MRSMAGISYAIVTDGDKWEMYEVFKPAKKLEEKPVNEVGIVSTARS